MKTTQLPGALVATAIALVVTACGSESTTASPSDSDSGSGSSASSSSTSTEGSSGPTGTEQITPGAIALVVLDHLGQDTVRQVVTFAGEGEEEGVGVMVRLRDRTPHSFSISVYPPEAAEEYGVAGSCPQMRPRKRMESHCRVLDDGTTVTTNELQEGFSDDNRNGSVLMGTAIRREDGALMAMYESYDESPAISAAELEELLSDPRLTWLTDPDVVEAGEDVPVKEVAG